MSKYNKYSHEENTLIFCLEVLRVVQEAGQLINESGISITNKGIVVFDQMVADGFKPSNMDILFCLCSTKIFEREHIPYFFNIIAATRDKGITWLQEAMNEFEKLSDLDVWNEDFEADGLQEED